MSSVRGVKVKEYVIATVPKDKRQDPGHNLEHILRVYQAGMIIGNEESANIIYRLPV